MLFLNNLNLFCFFMVCFKKSYFFKDELSNLMGKVKEVITENEGLHERRKSGMLQSLFDSFEFEDDDDDDDESSEDKVLTNQFDVT